MSGDLPTMPGSVVEADLENMGKVRRRVLLLTAYGPHPWHSQQDVCDRAYWDDTDLRNVRVIYTHEPTP